MPYLNPLLSRRLFALLALCSLIGSPLFNLPQASGDTGVSILQPGSPNKKQYSFPFNAIDPSAANNPTGANSPGFRGESQMVIYTPVFGASTGTNEAGMEAVVSNGVIVRTGGSDNPIPADGFIISAHGSAAQWLSRFAKPGANAIINSETGQITIQLTPAAYLYQVDSAIERATSKPAASPDNYQRALQQAQSCRTRLAEMANQPISSQMTQLAEQCEADANRAYYATMASVPQEFRGIWIRPAGSDPAQIRQVIAGLKQAHIGNVFLETYFQGKTAYPSQVMLDYGLTEQHPQFKGGDPVEVWMNEAHQAGIKVHLWTQVFFAGNQRENSEQYGPILQKYPEWRNIQRPNWNVKTPVISEIEPGHYFLDPANPEVRAFLEKLLLEMVDRYHPDGLNLDYIRYPASAPANKPYYLGTTWGYTESARHQFQAMIAQERKQAEEKKLEALKNAGKPLPPTKTTAAAAVKDPANDPTDPKNLTPKDPLWTQWVDWRKEQVSSFVKTISQKAHTIEPNLLISAVVFPSLNPVYAVKLQDYPRWAREGYIQAITPIGLSTNPALMTDQGVKLRAQVQDKIPVYVGVFGLYNRNTPVELVQQIEAIHQANMPGVVLFDWSRINPAYEEALLEGPFRQ